jgi:transposase
MLPDKKKNNENPVLGRSCGGLTTKIHAATDQHGRPHALVLSAGQDADINYATRLFYRTIARAALKHPNTNVAPRAVLADKAYDANAFVDLLDGYGIEVVIPSRSNRTEQRVIDKQRYKNRNQVERFFNRIKHCRRVATRYEKTARNFLAFVLLAAALVYL